MNPFTIREHLLAIAHPYAASLRRRPGVAGMMLYGSLVRGSLTPFSDVDMAVFYEGIPPCGIERRVVQGVKVDLISFPLENVTKLLCPLPRSLDVGFPFFYVLESLLLAGDESILYDPTGELLRVKTCLGEELSYQQLKRVSLSEGYHHFYRVNLEQARSLLEQGQAAGALEKAQWSGGALAFLLKSYAISKETREAAERLGIPGFADRREELASILAPPGELVEAVCAATRALWDFSMEAAAEPVKDHLRTLGVLEPEGLELVGDYDLFWPGFSLNELGRVMDEVNFSLRWSRCELDQGKGADSLQHLWGCWGTQGVRHRWERLSAALKDTGYDCSLIIEPMLEDTEFVQLGQRLDRAIKAIGRKSGSPEAAQRALELTGEMERLLVQVIPLMSQEELAEWKG